MSVSFLKFAGKLKFAAALAAAWHQQLEEQGNKLAMAQDSL